MINEILKNEFSVTDIKREKVKIIYYSVNTLWWTHDPKDLQGNKSGIPLDYFGSPLFESNTNLNELRERGYLTDIKMATHAKNIQGTLKQLVPRSNDEMKIIMSSTWDELKKEMLK